MNPEEDGSGPENRLFIQYVIEYVRDSVSHEELQNLLTDDNAWERVVTEAGLSRNVADGLLEALNKLYVDLVVEDMLQIGLLDGENFLSEFPQMKMDLENCIGELHVLADKIQKTHRDCTISNVVANSTGVLSGILTITGLALAPVTAGVSLGLTATGMGLGTAAAVTSVSATIVDHSVSLSAKAKASKLVSTDNNTQEEIVTAVGQNTGKLVSIARTCIKDSRVIEKNIKAFKLVKANPRLAANARRFMTNGSISVRKGRQVQKAFEGTALAMTKGARMVGIASTGVFLLMDVASLVMESKHLSEGAKAESAEELRLKASMVEKKLKELTQIYESLQRLAQRH